MSFVLEIVYTEICLFELDRSIDIELRKKIKHYILA